MRRLFTHKYAGQVLRKNYCSRELQKSSRVFSAIQPTGKAHLGNYLGALKKWVDLQNSEESTCIYGIADLHSITLPKEPKELQRNILLMAATVFGCGINTDKSIFFQQSTVKQHSELCWILATLTTMARLAILPQYKDKCKLIKDPSVGIFLYPVLQTADIMLYRTTHVPVGEDQLQQIYLAQHLTKSFNNRFRSNFPVPHAIFDSSAGRIKSLADPQKKMSKSDASQYAAIGLLDEPDIIIKKVKKAVTDCTSRVTFNPENRPGVSNLIQIHSGLTGKTPQEIVDESKNLDTGKYKLVLADVIVEHLKPIKKKIIEYLNAEEYLISELEKGGEKAREIAERNMKEIRERVGLEIKISASAEISSRSATC